MHARNYESNVFYNRIDWIGTNFTFLTVYRYVRCIYTLSNITRMKKRIELDEVSPNDILKITNNPFSLLLSVRPFHGNYY